MGDLVVLAVFAAFTALCIAYVRWCDQIIGPDGDLPHESPTAEPDREEVTT